MSEVQNGANLTQIAYLRRQTVKFGSIVLVSLIVGRTLFTAFVSYWKATHPPAPPPPTVGFGILPSLRFPEKTTAEKPTSYKLETATGGLDEFGDRSKVFLMVKSAPSLLDDENAKKIAANLDFVFSPQLVDTNTYRFSKTQPLESVLEINTKTLHFSLTTDYLTRPELLVNKNLPDGVEAVTKVKGNLGRLALLPADVATASGQTIYMKTLGDSLTPALSFSDADFIQIELSRNPIDQKYAMYSPDGQKSAIHAVMASGLGDSSIVELEYRYQEVDYTQVHTYPIRTAQSAWKLLQAGEGYVADKGEFDTATVRSVKLGYYDDFEEQDYLQPIYVFEGDGGFIGYVSAIDPKFIQGSQTQ